MDIKDYVNDFKRVIENLEKRYNFVSFFVQKEKRGRVSSSSKISNATITPEKIGFVCKAFNGGYFMEYASSELSKESIKNAEKYLSDNYSFGGTLSIPAGEYICRDFKQKIEIDSSSVPVNRYLAVAKKQRNTIAMMSSKIQEINVFFSYVSKEELYVNRNKMLFQKLNHFTNAYNVIFKDGDKIADIFGGHCKIGGFEHADIKISDVQEDISKGEKLLYADRLKAGMYDCILSPSVSGMLAHEAFGHGTESDMFLKDRAKGKEYIGKRVASSLINMYDSPNMNDNLKANGSYFFDNEGILAKDVQIIKDGVLVSNITDLHSALKLGVNITSNSRAESYTNKVYARMTNTYFSSGESSLEDMIKGTKYGFLIENATNGMEDPKSWGMHIEALVAKEIIDGKVTGKIFSPIILTGYVPDILNSVSAVSKDFDLATLGYCGKGHKEWVKVTDGGPYIKLRARLA